MIIGYVSTVGRAHLKKLTSLIYCRYNQKTQESPAVADKPALRESMPKLLPIRRACLQRSLRILVYLHSFSCCMRPKSAKSLEIL